MPNTLPSDPALIEHARFSCVHHLRGRIFAFDRRTGALYEWSEALSGWVQAAKPIVPESDRGVG